MFMQPSVAALNHLLAQNGWALARLARFSGKTAKFDIPPFSFSYLIQADGSLHGADAADSADAVCEIPLSLLPRLALQDEKAYAEIHTTGDAALLAEIFHILRNLRWDVAQELRNVTGDSAAQRIVQTLQEHRQKLLDTAAVLPKMAKDYLIEEHPLLARPQQVAEFIDQVDELRDAVARLEQRIERIARN